MKKIMLRALLSLASMIGVATCLLAEEKIDLMPSAAYDQCIIYQNLAIFWIAILGLVLLLRLKLKEIERIQVMGIDKEEEKIPLLE